MMDAEDPVYFPFSPEALSVVLGLARHGSNDTVTVERSTFNELRSNRLFSFSNLYGVLKALDLATRPQR